MLAIRASRPAVSWGATALVSSAIGTIAASELISASSPYIASGSWATKLVWLAHPSAVTLGLRSAGLVIEFGLVIALASRRYAGFLFKSIVAVNLLICILAGGLCGAVAHGHQIQSNATNLMQALDVRTTAFKAGQVPYACVTEAASLSERHGSASSLPSLASDPQCVHPVVQH